MRGENLCIKLIQKNVSSAVLARALVQLKQSAILMVQLTTPSILNCASIVAHVNLNVRLVRSLPNRTNCLT